MSPITQTNFSKGSRRQWLLAGLAAWACASASPLAQAHTNMGPVQPPLGFPPLPLKLSNGASATLAALLEGHITAVQLMFTGCSAVCPIQGALFAGVQQQWSKVPEKGRLLSVSIDFLGDGPQQLQQWLSRFHADTARWQAGVPSATQGEHFIDQLQGRASGPDRHTGQVFIFNRKAKLAFKTVDLPAPHEVISAMRLVSLAT